MGKYTTIWVLVSLRGIVCGCPQTGLGMVAKAAREILSERVAHQGHRIGRLKRDASEA